MAVQAEMRLTMKTYHKQMDFLPLVPHLKKSKQRNKKKVKKVVAQYWRF